MNEKVKSLEIKKINISEKPLKTTPKNSGSADRSL